MQKLQFSKLLGLGAKVGNVEPTGEPLNFEKLVEFGSVASSLSEGVDFQDATVGAKLGAKVGAEVCLALDLRDSGFGGLAGQVDQRVILADTDVRNMKQSREIDFTKLLGFEGISDQLSGSVDFQDDTINAKLGAKVGVETMM